MADKWMSIPQMARELQAVEVTIRRYIERLPEFFTCEVEGGVSRYKPESMDVLRRIQELYSQKKRKNEIREILEKEVLGKSHTEQTVTPEPMPASQAEYLDVLRGIKNSLDALVNEVRELKEYMKSER